MISLEIRLGSAAPISSEALLRALPDFPRDLLERLVESAIDRLDRADGDPDVELNGDEAHGTSGEDDFIDRGQGFVGPCSGPGCPVSDPGGDEHDGREPEDV